jgi:pimeloyl-ACP methyl ester carboxylesterase
MKFLLIIFTGFFTLMASGQNLYPQLYDNSNGITNCYGTWGNNNYVREATIDIANKGQITFYHPDSAVTANPTIFFISGWGQEYYIYDKFFKYLASLGYSVVNIYNYNPGSIAVSYQNSLDMMQTTVNTYPDWIDTTKVGLMGHSYGGGATIWLGKQIFDANGLNWGSNGRLIMVFAPWLSFLVEDTDLQNYPAGVKLLMIQSYDDLHDGGPNYNTDPRALRAVYELINIPDSEKDFITIFSDDDPNHTYTYNNTTYAYEATHYVCYTGTSLNPYDALDAYSSNRLADALLSYVFKGDAIAKNVALGNGSAVQKDMGVMPDLAVTDYYITTRPESVYQYKCSENQPETWGDPSIWKLQDYCDDSDGDGIIDALALIKQEQQVFKIFPVPASNFIQFDFTDDTNIIQNISISDMSGKQIIHIKTLDSHTFDISALSPGTYFIQIKTAKSFAIQKFVKI